jgi:hypothetical protein
VVSLEYLRLRLLEQPVDTLGECQRRTPGARHRRQGFIGAPIRQLITAVQVMDQIGPSRWRIGLFDRAKVVDICHIGHDKTTAIAPPEQRSKFGYRRVVGVQHQQGLIRFAVTDCCAQRCRREPAISATPTSIKRSACSATTGNVCRAMDTEGPLETDVLVRAQEFTGHRSCSAPRETSTRASRCSCRWASERRQVSVQ